jgi:hypothetical protein
MKIEDPATGGGKETTNLAVDAQRSNLFERRFQEKNKAADIFDMRDTGWR